MNPARRARRLAIIGDALGRHSGWASVPYALLLFLAGGVFTPAWRSPEAVFEALLPRGQILLWADSPRVAFVNALGIAASYAPIGAYVRIRGGRARAAGGLAFGLAFAVQICRLLKPGLLPDFASPFIAATASVLLHTVLARCCRWRGRCRGTCRRSSWRHPGLTVTGMGLVAGVLTVSTAIFGIAAVGITPSQLASAVQTRAEGHNAIVVALLRLGSAGLLNLDRLRDRSDGELPRWAGAGQQHDGAIPVGHVRPVGSIAELRQAVSNAKPGDVIVLQPGTYRLSDGTVGIGRSGRPDAPITLRASVSGQVVMDSDLVEAFKVAGSDWHFENLVIRGKCADDSACEHAFHIVGGADRVVLRNLRLEDFNAQIKVNGEGGRFPDGGRITFSTLRDRFPRRTANPVTPVDIDGASDWVVENSLIADFAKRGGDSTSYGAYFKAAGRNNTFQRNIVLCEWRMHDQPGARIGLSFGGGGSGPAIRRDSGLSGYEQADSRMANNLIAFCSDDGIYINRSPGSVIVHNTLIDTAGIDVRFVESSADADENLVDGPIRARDGALVRGRGNVTDWLLGQFLGLHPARGLFVDPARLDLRWRDLPLVQGPVPVGMPEPDVCGQVRPEGRLPGAFTDFRTCGAAGRKGYEADR